MPLLDGLIGEDANNPPEEVVPQLEEDRYYRWLTWATVPLHFVALVGCAWWVGTHDLSWWALLMFAYVAGTDSGLGINTGHELGHKRSGLEAWLARFVLAVPAYGHFTVEHGRGHHRWVSTPEDHASARMGESIYRFALRELPGGIRRAWRLEGERLAGLGALDVERAQHDAAVVRRQRRAAARPDRGVRLGHAAVPDRAQPRRLVAAHVGELRRALRPAARRLPNGQYEAPQPHHSWNTNHLVTNLALFHLQRHSDHHAYPSRRYQSLRHFEQLPQLPSGYFGMFPLSYVPPLWFRVMDPRLLALPDVAGDLERVNVDPARRERLRARYGGAMVASG